VPLEFEKSFGKSRTRNIRLVGRNFKGNWGARNVRGVAIPVAARSLACACVSFIS